MGNQWYWRTGNDQDVVTVTGVKLFRNLEGIPFPARMSVSDRRRVLRQVGDAAMNPNSSVSGLFRSVDLELLSGVEAVSLAERRLIDAALVSDRVGSGLLLTEDEALSVEINGENHLTIQALGAGAQLKEQYAAADGIDTFFDKNLSYAFDPQFGYLTQNPLYLGTGMTASLDLHLPALERSGSAVRIAMNLMKLGLSLHGAYGPESGTAGAVYRLSNRVTLGLSEQEALANLDSIAGQIIARERKMREECIRDAEVQDDVWRNLGVLQNVRLLSFSEYLERINAVRLGVAAGLLPGISLSAIDAVSVQVQPATLVKESAEPLSLEERHKLRARLVRGVLGGEKEDLYGN